jgi:hypothetical protein
LYIRHGKGSWSRNSVLACISLTGEVPHWNYHIQSQSVKGADFMNFMESLTYPSESVAFHRSWISRSKEDGNSFLLPRIPLTSIPLRTFLVL